MPNFVEKCTAVNCVVPTYLCVVLFCVFKETYQVQGQSCVWINSNIVYCRSQYTTRYGAAVLQPNMEASMGPVQVVWSVSAIRGHIFKTS